MRKRLFFIVPCLVLCLAFLFANAGVYAADSGDSVSLKVKTKTLYKGDSFKNRLVGAKGQVKWSSSNKKIATVSKSGKVKAKKYGKCVINAKYKGKKYKCQVKVAHRKPDFDAVIVDVDSGSDGIPFVKVKFKNHSAKALKINPKAKYTDFTDPVYSVKTKSKKPILIKGHKTKTVKFLNYGRYYLYNHAGRKDPDIFAFLQSRFKYSFSFDGKKHRGTTKWVEETDDDGDLIDYYDSTYDGGTPTNKASQ